MTMTESDRAWALSKATLVADAVATNLRIAGDHPYALPERRTARSGVFVCVGAGPSLSRTGPELRRLQSEGAVIATVNTALAAVNRYVVPDVVLAREVVDVSSHLSHPARLRVLDIAASPKVWSAAIAAGPVAWFCPYVELCSVLGVRPLFGGPAALTALVELVQQWGAARVILVGCDLALADDGASYADGSAFSGQRASIDESGVATNSGSGFAAKQLQHASAGVEAYPTQEHTVVLERYGGGFVRTTPQWADQIPWLTEFARRHPDVECIDATGSGARKRGWREDAIGDVSGEDPTSERLTNVEPASVPALPLLDTVPAALASIVAQCRTTIDVAANVTDPDGTIVAVPNYLRGSDLVDLAAAEALIRNRERPGTLAEKIRGAYAGAYAEAAKRLLAIVEAP